MKITKLVFEILIITLPLAQLARLPVGDQTVGLYLVDILVALAVGVWLFYSLGIRKKFPLPPLALLIALFSAIAFVSLINGKRFLTVSEFFVSSMYWLRFVLYAGVYFVVIDLVRTFGEKYRGRVLNLLILSGFLLAIFGFVQLVILPDFSKLDPTLGWDPHRFRLASTFFDPNFTGAYLVLTLIVLVVQLLSSFSLTLATVTSVIFVALILTFSRSAWLMFAASTGVIGVFKSRLLLAIALIAFVTAYLLVPRVQTRIAGGVDPDDSASARIVSWQRTSEIIIENPILGVGFNSFRYAQTRYGFFDYKSADGGRAGAGSDSSLLLVFATTGLLGFITYLTLLARIGWRPLTQLLNKSKVNQTFPLILLASLTGLLVESNFINSLFYPWIMVWFWVIVGLAFSLEDTP